MTTTSLGREAEDLVAKQLGGRGYKIIYTNWRTRYCEIDIVATKGKTVYFIEVKYRKSSNWGDGFDAITSKKLKQMKFAAEIWLSNNKWEGQSLLMVASVAGEPPQILDIIEL